MVSAGVLGLVDGVLYAFQPDLDTLPAVMAGAVARSKNCRIGGHGVVVHDNAVLARQTGFACQHVIGKDPDTDQHNIGFPCFSAGMNGLNFLIYFKLFYASVKIQLYSGVTMCGGIKIRNRGRNRARHQPVGSLEHRHLQAPLGPHGRHLQPDVTTSHDHQPGAWLEGGLEDIHVGDVAQNGKDREGPRPRARELTADLAPAASSNLSYRRTRPSFSVTFLAARSMTVTVALRIRSQPASR